MFCAKCGKELQADSAFCPSCDAVLGEQGKTVASKTARRELERWIERLSSQQGRHFSGMRLAATILGIIGGIAGAIAGAIGGLMAMFVGGTVGADPEAVIFADGLVALVLAIVAIAGVAKARQEPKVAGILMLTGGIGGIVCMIVAYAFAGGLHIFGSIMVGLVLLISGGILALIAARKAESAEPAKGLGSKVGRGFF